MHGSRAARARHGEPQARQARGTLVAVEAWADVCRELGVELSWHIRRANFLVEGLDLAETIGKTISIGEVEVYVHGESKPCQLMDDQHAGLRETLKPHGRGGVFGQVKAGGTVRIGDTITTHSR